MNNRTKMLVSAAVVVLVVAVIAVMLLQSPTGDLSGGTVLEITPDDPVIEVGQTVTLSVNSVYACNWESSNAGVSFVGETDGVKTVTVRGNDTSLTTIEARCGLLRSNKVYTNIRVNPAPLVQP